MNSLLEIDRQFLLAINSWNASWADTLMWYISSRWIWIPLYILLIALLCWRFGWKRALWIVFVMVCAVGLADSFTTFLKHSICRLRPTHEPLLEGLVHVVNGYTGGLFGFPSSHASNTCMVAILFALVWTRPQSIITRTINHASWAWSLLLFPALNCYSRMYLGVHYPLDILVGIIIGMVVALVAYRVCLLPPPARRADSSEPVAYGDAPPNGGS